MSGIKRLAGDTVIYGLSTIVSRMLGYLLVPYLTRMMNTGEYGVYTDIYSLIPFALVVLTMGLESGYFRFAGRAADEAEKIKIFSTLWKATIVTAIVFGVAMIVLGRSEAALITMGIVAMDVATAMPFARLREQRRRLTYVGIKIVAVTVNVALCVWFYSFKGFTGVEWALWANLAASAIATVALAPMLRDAKKFDWGVFKTVMVYSLPLLVSGVAGTAGEFIDRQMIKWLMPENIAMSSLGIYGATTKLAVVMILFTQMYRLAAEPFFLAKFAKGDFERQTKLAMRGYLLVAALIFAGVMVFRPWIMYIIGEDFREGGHLLPILLAANALAGVVLNLSWWYKQAGRTWIAIAITGTGLAVALGLNFILVPRMGYEGAAWARLACETAMVIVSLILMKRYAGKSYQSIGV